MMLIRPYKPEDLEAITRLHDNPAYQMPDLNHPLMVVRRVLVDENDVPRLAGFARIQANVVLFVDHSWLTPLERLDALEKLQNDMLNEGRIIKLDIVTTQMEGRFAERMQQLGWIKAWGDLYYHAIPTDDPTNNK